MDAAMSLSLTLGTEVTSVLNDLVEQYQNEASLSIFGLAVCPGTLYGVCSNIDRIMSGGWGFPISATAAFIRDQVRRVM
jgi:hypothetical protein